MRYGIRTLQRGEVHHGECRADRDCHTAYHKSGHPASALSRINRSVIWLMSEHIAGRTFETGLPRRKRDVLLLLLFVVYYCKCVLRNILPGRAVPVVVAPLFPQVRLLPIFICMH